MKPGTILKWKEPQSITEESERFILAEDREDRLLVTETSLLHWPIPPQSYYKATDLVEAMEPCRASRSAIVDDADRAYGPQANYFRKGF